jgi:hypothetical protein
MCAASLNIKTASCAVTCATLQELLGTISLDIPASLVSIVSKAGSGPRSAAVHILCTFKFFAYLVFITDTDQQTRINLCEINPFTG